MTRDEFIRENPIVSVLEQRGANVVGQGNQRNCRCLFHEDRTASMSVDVVKGLWFCHAGCGGGSVIDLIAKLDSTTPAELLKRSGVTSGSASHRGAITHTQKATPRERKPATGDFESPPPKFETVRTYDYHDMLGGLVYQVVRMHAEAPDKSSGYIKTFRQRQPDNKGGWIWGMDGVERFLYRLPEVVKSKTVWIVEGEKDAETLVSAGLCATCNVGGAGKWMEGYNEYLHKKNVVICGDNDEAGQKHSKLVFDSVVGKAKTLRMVKVPELYKDVTEYAESFKDQEVFKRAIRDLHDAAIPFIKGVSLPIFKISELEPLYQRHVERMKETAFKLSNWLPSLAPLRSLVPGELALFLGGTGIGKTAALSNIVVNASPMPSLFFQLELPPELMYERLVSLKTKIPCKQIEENYSTGGTLGEDAFEKRLSHIYICTQPRLTVQNLEELIVKSELKIGERPKLVLVDYIGLLRGTGKSRYERVSQVAEDLKVMAKATQTIVIVASQIARKDGDEPDVGLSDGKDSGSLENSAGLVVGMWREEDTTIKLRVLKSTKGGAGTEVTCNYNLGTLAITERSRFS